MTLVTCLHCSLVLFPILYIFPNLEIYRLLFWSTCYNGCIECCLISDETPKVTSSGHEICSVCLKGPLVNVVIRREAVGWSCAVSSLPVEFSSSSASSGSSDTAVVRSCGERPSSLLLTLCVPLACGGSLAIVMGAQGDGRNPSSCRGTEIRRMGRKGFWVPCGKPTDKKEDGRCDNSAVGQLRCHWGPEQIR